MKRERHSEFEITPRMQEALDELQGMIAARFPDATFSIEDQPDAPGIALVATVDIEDTDEVFAVVVDRLVDLQVEEGLPVHVMPLQPKARVMAQLREQQARARLLSATG